LNIFPVTDIPGGISWHVFVEFYKNIILPQSCAARIRSGRKKRSFAHTEIIRPLHFINPQKQPYCRLFFGNAQNFSQEKAVNFDYSHKSGGF
jgi:hypothetical protein